MLRFHTNRWRRLDRSTRAIMESCPCRRSSRQRIRFCHYEHALKTINLTRTHSEGLLAHEFAHFIDHQFGITYLKGEKTPFLSDALGVTGGGQIVGAFCEVIGAIGVARRWQVLTGDPEPRRWFASPYVLSRYSECEQDIQRTYESITELAQNRARHESFFQMTADSLAKWTKQPVTVRSFHKSMTSYTREAKKVGVYWYGGTSFSLEHLRAGWKTN